MHTYDKIRPLGPSMRQFSRTKSSVHKVKSCMKFFTEHDIPFTLGDFVKLPRAQNFSAEHLIQDKICNQKWFKKVLKPHVRKQKLCKGIKVNTKSSSQYLYAIAFFIPMKFRSFLAFFPLKFRSFLAFYSPLKFRSFLSFFFSSVPLIPVKFRSFRSYLAFLSGNWAHSSTLDNTKQQTNGDLRVGILTTSIDCVKFLFLGWH